MPSPMLCYMLLRLPAISVVCAMSLLSCAGGTSLPCPIVLSGSAGFGTGPLVDGGPVGLSPFQLQAEAAVVRPAAFRPALTLRC